MSLTELKLLAQLENRQKKVNKGLQGFVKEETLKSADEPYLLEDEDIPLMYIPSKNDLYDNLSAQELNEISEYIINILMPPIITQIQEEYENNPRKDEYVQDVYIKKFTEEINARRLEEYNKYLEIYLAQKQNRMSMDNIGERPTERLPNETDEQFIDRLETIQLSIPDQDSIIASRKLKIRNELRDSLKTIMKQSDAEAVLNDRHLFDDNDITTLNQVRDKFLKDIRGTFKTIDINTFKDYTRNYLDTFQYNKGVSDYKEKYGKITDNKSYGDVSTISNSIHSGDFGIDGLNDNQLEGYETFVQPDAYRNYAQDTYDDDNEDMDRFVADLRFTPVTERNDYEQLLGTQELNAYRGYTPSRKEPGAPVLPLQMNELPTMQNFKTSKEYRDYLLNRDTKIETLQRLKHFQESKDFGDYFKDVKTRYANGKTVSQENIIKSIVAKARKIQREQHINVGFGIQNKRSKSKTIYGKGISLPEEREDRFYQFGKFLLDNDKLNNNIVRIIYASTGSGHPKIKNTLVSEDFKDILLDTILKSNFSERAYKRLNKDEKIFMKSILEKSGVSKILQIKSLQDDDETHLMDRWQVLQGEFEIGNDSPTIKEEAKQIITHFISTGKITKSEGYKMLYSLSN